MNEDVGTGGGSPEQFGPARIGPSANSAFEPPHPGFQPVYPPAPTPTSHQTQPVSHATPAHAPAPAPAPPTPHAPAPTPVPPARDATHVALASGVHVHAQHRPPVGALPSGSTRVGGRRRREPHRIRRSAALLAVAGALVVGSAGGVIGSQAFMGPTDPAAPLDNGAGIGGPVDPTPQASPTAPAAAPTPRADATVAEVAAQVLPSTVYIEVVTSQGMSSGTGMVLRPDGYLVTNNHVIAAGAEDGGTIHVTFPDGDVQVADVVGRTKDYDLAVLHVERTDLAALPLANSDAVVVGDPVVAVGAPLGLDGTVTSGIVSALNRAVTAGSAQEVSYINAIQTDAAINPGNSGGPLVNMRGEVIGINSAIAQPQGSMRATGSIGLGFAIPSNQVARTTEQLIENGFATYPIIGVLLDGRHTGEGVLVSVDGGADGTPAISPGGPGEAAGIQPGDIILRLDGRPVTSPDEVIVTVRSHAPGDTVTFTIRRGGEDIEIPIELGERQAE